MRYAAASPLAYTAMSFVRACAPGTAQRAVEQRRSASGERRTRLLLHVDRQRARLDDDDLAAELRELGCNLDQRIRADGSDVMMIAAASATPRDVVGRLPAVAPEPTRRFRQHVVADHAIAGAHEIGGHRRSHDAETDDADDLAAGLLTCSCGERRARVEVAIVFLERDGRVEQRADPVRGEHVALRSPTPAIRPWLTRTIRWISGTISSMWCVIRMIVVPARAICRTRSVKSCRATRSRPVVGSSRISARGAVTSARASSTRRASPVDISSRRRFARCAAPMRASASVARLSHLGRYGAVAQNALRREKPGQHRRFSL